MPRKKPETPASSDPPRAPIAPPIALRVRTIRRHLEARTWGAEVASELEATWGVTAAMVRGHAAEAARQLEAVLDAQAAPRAIDADLSAALDLAFDQGDMGAVRGLLETKLKLYGIGQHHSQKNDPKPAASATAPTEPPKRPFWRKEKAEDKPS